MTKPSDLFQANVEMWRYVTGQNAELVQKTIKQYGDLAYKNWECFLTQMRPSASRSRRLSRGR